MALQAAVEAAADRRVERRIESASELDIAVGTIAVARVVAVDIARSRERDRQIRNVRSEAKLVPVERSHAERDMVERAIAAVPLGRNVGGKR